MRLRSFALALLLIVAASTAQAARLVFPQLTGRVVDSANILDAGTVTALDSILAGHEDRTGEQVVVATVSDLQGQDIADYGYQLGRSWGIGQKGKDNGVLLIVAPTEKAVRIEVGYGLEGVLTDAISGMIIDQLILPAFRQGDLPGGIVEGTRGIVTALGDPTAFTQTMRQQHTDNQGENGTPLPGWLIILIIVVILLLRFKGISGGFSGGGGFRGGGGGFGGGGSSGRW